MLGKVLLVVCATVSCATCDWVKIPQLSNVPKVTYKIQSVASFSDLPSSSLLTNSNVLSSVFSYDQPTTFSTTTDKVITTEASYTHQTTVKKYFPTTVTSKAVDFEHKIADRIDYEEIEMEPVRLLSFESDRRKVIYMNQTVPLKVLPILVETGKKMTSNQDSDSEEDDDGVTIVDDDEELDISHQEDEEDYYEYDEPASSSTTTTTTKAPRKSPIRKVPQKPQKRIVEMMNMKAKVHNHLSFSSFLKFLKNIQESFATRTAKNISEKIKMLSQFRDSLLLTINQRIKSLWKTQSKTKKKKKHRSKRTLGGGGGWMEHGSGMDFPSAEGALLSISFLTFAVFLIKLVLVSAGKKNSAEML